MIPDPVTHGATSRMPVLFLSHGAPPLADDPVWTSQLATWSSDMPRPESVLMVSAHWESDPLTISATRAVPLFYDFWGFPERYYQVEYPAPGAPDLAKDVERLLGDAGQTVARDEDRGLDHGAYVPLVEMYPNADVPVLQISMPTLDPVELFEIGKRLAPLRDLGVLIVGSGFSTHNLELALGARRPSTQLVRRVRRMARPAVERPECGRVARLPRLRSSRLAGPSAHRAFCPVVFLPGSGRRSGLGVDRTSDRLLVWIVETIRSVRLNLSR